ncbi:VanW family protein [Marivirga arenosa]|uniref:VanW family protein n=1 Tax=Marivirga arenosa TaxID=3059076 RepID=A0AA49GCV0_9BACT|nr:VanW family protein [Marivirga sp. BKB1-2]WKK78866.2 VanW family protein [Marivirga sp. BKB1-2]
MNVPKPKIRSQLRRKLGKEFYIIKRKWDWMKKSQSFAKTQILELLPEVVFSHKSFLLRPLKDVDMQLQINKITNLELANERISKIVIPPGKTFSFWYLVGKPSSAKGYLPGLILNQGRIESGVGGGLCQLGNLLFWMIMHSPLEVTERYRHGFDVFPDVNRKIPFGAGATLAYNYIDFQFKNTTDITFQLELYLTKEYLNGNLRADKPLQYNYELIEADHLIKHQSWGGYTRHNRLVKKVIDKENNELVEEDVKIENNAIMMYEPFLED